MQAIDWYGLVNAIILLITAVTLMITLWNQKQLRDHGAKIDQLNGGIQMQLDRKVDKHI
jgi:hypothetical protein